MKPGFALLGFGFTACSASLGITLGTLVHPPPPPAALVCAEPRRTVSGPRPLAGRPPQPFQVRFDLRNVGGRPVKLLGVRSSCGCAVPEVGPKEVRPYGSTYVVVETTAQAVGDGHARITVETDAKATPEVALALHVQASNEPPFLIKPTAPVLFVGDRVHDLQGAQFLSVDLIERPGDHRAPEVEVEGDLDFLDVLTAGTEEIQSSVPGTVVRRHHFRVGFRAPPPAWFSGSLAVYDPWIEGRVEHVHVAGRLEPSVRVVPAAPVVGSAAGEAGFTVLWDRTIADVRVPADGGGGTLVECVAYNPADRTADFVVRAGAAASGECSLKVLRRDGGEEVLTVPLVVHGGGGS